MGHSRQTRYPSLAVSMARGSRVGLRFDATFLKFQIDLKTVVIVGHESGALRGSGGGPQPRGGGRAGSHGLADPGWCGQLSERKASLLQALRFAPDVVLTMEFPSVLAEQLAAGELDVALIPSVEYLRGAGRGYEIIPGIRDRGSRSRCGV